MKNMSSLARLILPIFLVGIGFILFINFGMDYVIGTMANSKEMIEIKKVMVFMLFLMLLLLSGTTYIIYDTYVREPMNEMIKFLEFLKDERYETYDKKTNTSDIDNFITQINKIISFLDKKDKDTKELIKQIQIKEAFTNDILDSQLNPIMVMKDQKVVSANKSFYKFFNDCMHLSGDNLNNYKIFIDKFKKEDGYIYNFEDKQWVDYILQNNNKQHQAKLVVNNKEIIFQINIMKIQDEQYIVSLSDVTEYIIALNKAQAAQAAKTTFLATMSHEIRTPLNGILGFAKLLESVDLPKKERGYISIINNSANSLLGIINDILDISKMESGKLELETHQFDPFKEFEPTVELFVAKADEKNIDLLFFLDPSLPRFLLGDSLKLKQVISNLLSNAIKFTPENGEILIRIELLETVNNKAKIKFSVKDSGVGIPKEQQANIFKPFSQADSSVTRKFGGTGLGLTICSKIVEAMNSKIILNSEANKGSEFSFTLELEAKEDRTVYQHIDDNLKVAIYCKELTCKSQLGIIKKYIEHYVKLDIIKDIDNVQTQDILIIEYKDFLELDSEDIGISTLIIINNEYKDINLKDNFKIIKAPINPSKLYDAIVEISNPHATDQIVHNDVLAQYNSTVLVAEDNFVNQQLMIAMLKQRGIEAIIANDGQEALDMIVRGDKFEIIFMDINMPNMNGIEATQKIIEYEKQNNIEHTPIVALTANAVAGDKERFLEEGMDEYIPKPFEEKLLNDVLAKYIKKNDENDIAQDVILDSQVLKKNTTYDIEASATSLGLQTSVFTMIFKTFLDHVNNDLDALEEAINEKNFTKIVNTAHKIKGASANLKIERIRELTEQMEHKAKTQIDDNFATKLQWLRNEVEKLKELFQEYQN
jgi:signal transduction histidine kinase/CheY-like chemotaxis protein/HPt (histidine-containing phosphotransfer) domain-containing protein